MVISDLLFSHSKKESLSLNGKTSSVISLSISSLPLTISWRLYILRLEIHCHTLNSSNRGWVRDIHFTPYSMPSVPVVFSYWQLAISDFLVFKGLWYKMILSAIRYSISLVEILFLYSAFDGYSNSIHSLYIDLSFNSL